MVAILSVLLIVGLSLVVTRVATVALTLTGLSREAARFQARSALTGAGFTTSESETVVQHPLRRRIVMALMLAGSAGIVTVIATLVAGLAGATGGQPWMRLATLAAGLGVLLWAASSRWFDRAMQPLIRRLLTRWGHLEARDYAAMLNIHGEYAVSELQVTEGSWLADRDLQDLRLSDEGVLVLGVHRDAETYIGAPRAEVVLQPGDLLVLYGHAQRIEDLDARPRGAPGERARVRAIADQRVREIHEEAVVAAEDPQDEPHGSEGPDGPGDATGGATDTAGTSREQAPHGTGG